MQAATLQGGEGYRARAGTGNGKISKTTEPCKPVYTIFSAECLRLIASPPLPKQLQVYFNKIIFE
ncbi:MAG TPA: hypothetical protein VGE06_13840, partial [Flavisolibacter sp.]